MRSLILLLLLTADVSIAASPGQSDSPYSESRDAASAYIGTNNFLIGRFGAECLPLVGRTESPKEFVQAWQQRNAKYFAASVKYMGKRLDDALAKGGVEQRDAVLREYAVAVRGNGAKAVDEWLGKGTKEEACKRAIIAIDAGKFDISPSIPIYDELEALAAWAQ